MDPVLGSIPHKVLLRPSSGGVAFGGVAASSDKIVEPGELDNEIVVVILEEGLGLEPGSKDRLQVPCSLFLSVLAHKIAVHPLGRLTSCFLMIFWKPV
jgi:hypothetical protein